MKKKLFSILPLIALGSCATQIDVDPLVETPEIQQQIEKVESTSSAIPDWFKELPEDEKMIYSSGTAIAPDLQLSVDIATMNAKTVLADRINGKLDSMTKQFIAKTGTTDLDSQVLNELERVLQRNAKKNFIDMQDGDIHKTHSDISLLETLTGFSPKTTVRQGITEFVKWYKSYYV